MARISSLKLFVVVQNYLQFVDVVGRDVVHEVEGEKCDDRYLQYLEKFASERNH